MTKQINSRGKKCLFNCPCCSCKGKSLFDRCEYPRCKCKENCEVEVEVEQGDIDVRQGQSQTMGNQTQNPIESQGQTLGNQTQNGTESQGQTFGNQTQSGSENQEQTLGDLTQNGNEGQSQTFGNLSQNASESQGQTMGNQTQNPSQGQSGSILSQTQNPSQTGSTVTQNQNPVQTQSGSATQTQSPSQTGSNQTQTTGPQTLQANPTNSSSADVTQNVSGVTVNVPVNVTVDCGCGKGFKCEKQQQQACCDCCARALGNLLRQVQQYQSTNLETINIYLINSPALAENPVLDQTITNVNDCATVSFATGPVVTTPSTTAQLCKVAGFSASTPGLITFLTNYANACTNNNPCTCNGDCGCGCGCGQCNCGNVFCSCNTCANGIGEQLNLHTGSLLNLVIEGVPTPIDGVRLLKVCDCLAFFMNDATSTFYVFTLCSIVAFTPAAPGPV